MFARQYLLLEGKRPYEDRGPYEHLPREKRLGKNTSMSEGYRRCCRSNRWIGQVLAMRMMKAEKLWDYDVIFAHVDGWVYEDNAKFLARIKEVYPDIGDTPGGTICFDGWIDAMWVKYRAAPGMPPTDARKKPQEGSR